MKHLRHPTSTTSANRAVVSSGNIMRRCDSRLTLTPWTSEYGDVYMRYDAVVNGVVNVSPASATTLHTVLPLYLVQNS